MRLRKSTLLPLSVEQVGRSLTRTALFHQVTAPMLSFEPVEPAAVPTSWAEGRYVFRLLVGGRLPIGEHTIDARLVTEPDPGRVGRQLVWHDAGFSDLIKVWDHRILLEDVAGMTRYTDQVEIHAGPLTVPAWLFAQAFYRHRQRRLARLATAGRLA